VGPPVPAGLGHGLAEQRPHHPGLVLRGRAELRRLQHRDRDRRLPALARFHRQHHLPAGDLAEFFPGARYRSKWFTIDPSRNALTAIGIHGQHLYVDLDSDTVIAKLATQPKAMDVPIDQRWFAAFSAITAHLA